MPQVAGFKGAGDSHAPARRARSISQQIHPADSQPDCRLESQTAKNFSPQSSLLQNFGSKRQSLGS